MGKIQIRHIVAVVCALIVSCTAVPVAATEQADSSSVAGRSETDEAIAGGYIADDVEVPALEEAAGQKLRKARAAAVTPASYDARDMGYVTPVKTQQNNTCWAYSAISMAESDLIAGGDPVAGRALTKDTADFSEDHLVYAFYHGITAKPLGDYREVGGNHIFTTFGFANWVGLAEESQTEGINWKKENVDLADLTLLTEDSVPDDANGVLILSPTNDLNAEDADKLIAYLNNGGKVLISTSYIDRFSEEMPNLTKVLSEFGLSADKQVEEVLRRV